MEPQPMTNYAKQPQPMMNYQQQPQPFSMNNPPMQAQQGTNQVYHPPNGPVVGNMVVIQSPNYDGEGKPAKTLPVNLHEYVFSIEVTCTNCFCTRWTNVRKNMKCEIIGCIIICLFFGIIGWIIDCCLCCQERSYNYIHSCGNCGRHLNI